MRRKLTFILILLLMPLAASAQFSLTGDDPGSFRWRQFRTPHFQVLFPSGCDSLGRIYAEKLEYWYPRVKATIGIGPNDFYRKPLPVILHTGTAVSNGIVTWLPRRIDLFTVPDASSPLPMSWEDQLITHESRHASQMQTGHAGKYKAFNVLLGDLFPGAMAALYGGPAFFEGDAVAAETELSLSGRGRNGGFLEYYRYSALNGESRDWWQWRYGSQKRYTPDYYRAGYLGITALRTVGNDPLYTKRYYANINESGWPFPLGTMDVTAKQATGKNFPDNFKDGLEALAAQWKAAAEKRRPFIKEKNITVPDRLHTEYKELCPLGDKLYAVRTGLERSAELVRITEGKVTRVCAFPSTGSHLRADARSGRIYWSENIPDPRWSLQSASAIRYLSPDGRKCYLTYEGRLFNPSVNPRTGDILAVEYPNGGGSAVVEVDKNNGKAKRRFKAPDGMQVVECICTESGELLASGITDNGAGLFAPESGFSTVMKEIRHTIKDLFFLNGKVYFTSDADGTDELYSFDGKRMTRLTSTPVGADWFRFVGDSILFASLDKGGRMIKKTSELLPVAYDSEAATAFPEAEALSEQFASSFTGTDTTVVSIGDSTPYSKLANIFRFHSWAPVFVNYDSVKSLSAESISSLAAPGVSAFFQNSLSTASGYVGAAFRPNSGWRPELHAKFCYSGLYPVLEATVDFNGREAYNYYPTLEPGKTTGIISPHNAGVPSLTASLKMYIPWNFSSGGWSRGVIPQLSISAGNDKFSTGNRIVPLVSASASLRAYAMRPAASSCIYPRIGAGVEIGYESYLGLSGNVRPAEYLYTYGYLPGVIRTHGLRVSALLGKTPADTFRMTADYVFPFAPVDWSFLSPVAYIRNFECTLHGIWYAAGGVSSFGADVCVRLGNLLLIPYDTRIGVTASYAPSLGQPVFGLLFSIDM